MADPVIEPALFRQPIFVVCFLSNLLGIGCTLGLALFMIQYLRLILDLSPLETGMWTAVPSLMFIAAAIYCDRIATRIGAARLVVAALLVYAGGMVLVSYSAMMGSLAGLVAARLLIAIGIAPVIITTTALFVGRVSSERTGAASAVSETGAELGGALGIALFGSLGAFVYRLTMGGTPLGTLGFGDQDLVRQSLAGAVSVAQRLGAGTMPALLQQARLAFSVSFAVSSLIGALALTGLALMAHRVLRKEHLETNLP